MCATRGVATRSVATRDGATHDVATRDVNISHRVISINVIRPLVILNKRKSKSLIQTYKYYISMKTRIYYPPNKKELYSVHCHIVAIY